MPSIALLFSGKWASLLRCGAFLLLITLVPFLPTALAQSLPTATKPTDLQVGAGYIRANPDYGPRQFNGYTIYGDLDPFTYGGVEIEYDHSSGDTPKLTESTVAIGARIRYPYRDFRPYIKIMAGIGSFSGGLPAQNATFGMYAGGAGLEYWLPRHLTVRADYEYQRWGSFPANGLQPNVLSIGLAYRVR